MSAPSNAPPAEYTLDVAVCAAMPSAPQDDGDGSRCTEWRLDLLVATCVVCVGSAYACPYLIKLAIATRVPWQIAAAAADCAAAYLSCNECLGEAHNCAVEFWQERAEEALQLLDEALRMLDDWIRHCASNPFSPSCLVPV